MNTWPNPLPPPDAVTVTAAVPVLPSLVARIVLEPAATARTSPLDVTVAMAELSEVQAMLRAVRMFPAESHGVAVSRSVSPTWRLAELGARLTDATGTPGRLGSSQAVQRATARIAGRTRGSDIRTSLRRLCSEQRA